MRQSTQTLTVATSGAGLYDITEKVVAWMRGLSAGTGLLTVYIRHTSASILVQENADPDVLADLQRFFSRLVPDGDPLFRHVAEGPDDMPAHVRSALTATSIGIPVENGVPVLGTWQGLYLFEHRMQPHRRHISLHFIGD